MLASPIETAEDIEAELSAFAVEDKFDGIRAHAHQGRQAWPCSRGTLDDVTGAVSRERRRVTRGGRDRQLSPRRRDRRLGRRTARRLVSSQLQKRLGGQKDPEDAVLAAVPAGLSSRTTAWGRWTARGCSKKPGRANGALGSTRSSGHQTGTLRLSEVYGAATAGELEVLFARARERGNEGLVLKQSGLRPTRPESGAARGESGSARWRALDVVVTAVEQGHGEAGGECSRTTRSRVRDGDGSVNVGKAYSGLTDEEIRRMGTVVPRHHDRSLRTRARGGAAASSSRSRSTGSSESARHKSGFALRFPRIVRLRPGQGARRHRDPGRGARSACTADRRRPEEPGKRSPRVALENAAVSRDGLAGFHPPVRDWFRGSFAAPTPAQKKGWPPISPGGRRCCCADRLGQDARRVPGGDRRLMFAPEPPKKERCRVALRLAAEGARGRRRAQPARAARGHRGGRRTRGRTASPARRRRPHRRHPAAERARIAPHAARHPHHDARVALSAAHIAGAREMLRDGRDGDRRRDPRRSSPTKRGAHLFLSLERLEALRPSATSRRCSASACRRRSGRSTRSRGCSAAAEADGRHDRVEPRPVEIVDAGEPEELRPDGRGRRSKTWRGSASCRRFQSGPRPLGAGDAHRSGRRSTRAGRADPAHRSTMIFVNSRRLAERLAAALNELAGRRDRARPSRLGRARASARDRGSPEARPAAGDRRHLVAGARHRHGRGRSGDPDRGAAVGRVGHAAHRPRRPQVGAVRAA